LVADAENSNAGELVADAENSNAGDSFALLFADVENPRAC